MKNTFANLFDKAKRALDYFGETMSRNYYNQDEVNELSEPKLEQALQQYGLTGKHLEIDQRRALLWDVQEAFRQNPQMWMF